MSLGRVKTHFEQWNREQDAMAFETSCATVEQAAETIGVTPARLLRRCPSEEKEIRRF